MDSREKVSDLAFIVSVFIMVVVAAAAPLVFNYYRCMVIIPENTGKATKWENGLCIVSSIPKTNYYPSGCSKKIRRL